MKEVLLYALEQINLTLPKEIYTDQDTDDLEVFKISKQYTTKDNIHSLEVLIKKKNNGFILIPQFSREGFEYDLEIDIPPSSKYHPDIEEGYEPEELARFELPITEKTTFKQIDKKMRILSILFKRMLVMGVNNID